ncbi:class I SAM-dependent methyltransferase [Amycolatopsis sp. NBC_01286]|uniref:class I SAM-dependent methyltransferase n=1 Tax=Amycolatopsis sp. NBC_01286 TaxID=2903560 RepID=UPI002E13B69D|nr:methyltransferase domain-containing protein [Amycolatopsis sp. NBC_01286]
MTKTRLAIRALRLALSGKNADPIHDYDAASADYDAFFTRVMGVHSESALDQVSIRPGQTVIELACGTGHLTQAMSERMQWRGVIRAVDLSSGMLAIAREKVRPSTELDVSFTEGDMQQFLRAQPDGQADIVVCGWAICYAKPVALLRQIRRVLRPGGEVVIVETRADALASLVTSLQQVFVDDPSLLTGLIRMSLPKNAQVVARWFSRAGLTVTHTGEGSETLPVVTPEAALEWVQRSGAAAGFKDAIDSAREQEVLCRVRDALAEQAASTAGLSLTHTFVVVTGVSPVDGEESS